jgi:hypothetical protein
LRRSCPYASTLLSSYLLVVLSAMVFLLTQGENNTELHDHKYVHVYHLVFDHWTSSHQGTYNCDKLSKNLHCEWTHAPHMNRLRDSYLTKNIQYTDNNTVSVAMYNVHNWLAISNRFHPAHCELPTNLTLGESEESSVRYHLQFDKAFRNYDGNSTISPSSTVPRVYHDVFLYELNLTMPLANFSSLIHGGSYVASDCHQNDEANSKRDSIVAQLRDSGVRVDGLGRCMHSPDNAEGVRLPFNPDPRSKRLLKRNAIGRYLFNMAFENSIEPGYITEKAFDALVAGSVPVYLGDHENLRALLPDPKAAIFVADYHGNITALAEYLLYLTVNETAYEEHRVWRQSFRIKEYHDSKDLLRYDWECRICLWAANAINQISHPPLVCNHSTSH